ncbi:MAG: hypothetical protein KF744_07695 [Taibaiella sp.]|nr:hypothetical protein [Taibaiella sp.]
MMLRRFVMVSTLIFVAKCGFAAASIADVAGEDPGLFIIMMALLAGVVITMLFLLLFLGAVLGCFILFLTLGIVSLSALTGLYYRSIIEGVATFITCSLAVAGGLMGGLLLSLLKILGATVSVDISVLVVAAGVFSGLLFSFTLKYIVRYLIGKLNIVV